MAPLSGTIAAVASKTVPRESKDCLFKFVSLFSLCELYQSHIPCGSFVLVASSCFLLIKHNDSKILSVAVPRY